MSPDKSGTPTAGSPPTIPHGDNMAAALPVLHSMGAFRLLERISIEPGNAVESGYNERWLQDLIQTCPDVLPTGEIEPGFGRLIGVSTEVACGHGFIDNLFVTAEGNIALVETKLWRNPEARRTVVAQALDYAAALARMNYSQFEGAALAGLFPPTSSKPPSLYSLVEQGPDALPEAEFIDAVSLNLRRGRMLVIAAGDGIRTETEALAELLQSHAGARFTFALVAIELFKAGASEILAVPRTIGKTVLVERGVVRIMDDRIAVDEEQKLPTAGPGISSSAPRVTLTEEQFMEALASKDKRLPAAMRSFLDRVAAIGVFPDWRQTLNLKWQGGTAGAVNLGYIRKEGTISTDAMSAKVDPAAAREYQEALARICGGKTVQGPRFPVPFLVALDGRSSVNVTAFLPDHADEWFAAISQFVQRVQVSQRFEEE